MIDPSELRYRRAARLLAQKLGVDWRTLPAEQVIEYLRKIEIAQAARDAQGRESSTHDSDSAGE
mgnify:CR=1 FL=1